MSKLLLTIIAVMFLSGGIFLSAGTVNAQMDFGTGPGCSPIEGVDATTLVGSGTCNLGTGFCSNDGTVACASDVDCLGLGDMFTGRIGTTAVNRVNKNNKPADNSDGDQCSDSIEECINDALFGFCTEVFVSDCDDVEDGITVNSKVTYEKLNVEGKKGNKRNFKVTFLDTSECAITECSDQVNNDGLQDSDIDFPDDPQCMDYSDDDESS